MLAGGFLNYPLIYERVLECPLDPTRQASSD